MKILKYLSILIFSYIIIFFTIYSISGLLLINNITPNISLITQYQINFYNHGGIRNIWQSNKDCIEFDKDLIFIPKKKNCNFKNLEFNTNISFDDYGRFSNHKEKKEKGIAVLGDSFAMGWGVNDKETFSAVLESLLDRPVYNLAVSGYGTIRELIRFKNSGLAESVDTVIIQYCYNDWNENNLYNENSLKESQKKFEIISNSKPSSFFKKLRKSFRYSLKIPIELITQEKKILDFNGHNEVLKRIIANYPILKNKNIIIIYANSYNMRFKNFPPKDENKINNLNFLDINLVEKDFYKIDGHLTKEGHKTIATQLYKYIKDI